MRFKSKHLGFVLLLILIVVNLSGCFGGSATNKAIVKGMNMWLKDEVSKTSSISYDNKTDTYTIKYVSGFSSTLKEAFDKYNNDKQAHAQLPEGINWDETKKNVCEFSKLCHDKIENYGVESPNVIVRFYDSTTENYYLTYSNGKLLEDKFNN